MSILLNEILNLIFSYLSSPTAPLMNRYITNYAKHLSITSKFIYNLPPSSFYYYTFWNIITPVVRNKKTKTIFFKYDKVIEHLERIILDNRLLLINRNHIISEKHPRMIHNKYL